MRSLPFLGGILVGFGLATSLFYLWLNWWMHHMFIMGVSSYPVLAIILMFPLLIILLGIVLAFAGRNRKTRP